MSGLLITETIWISSLAYVQTLERKFCSFFYGELDFVFQLPTEVIDCLRPKDVAEWHFPFTSESTHAFLSFEFPTHLLYVLWEHIWPRVWKQRMYVEGNWFSSQWQTESSYINDPDKSSGWLLVPQLSINAGKRQYRFKLA